jgi:hypothetical protein
MEAETVKQATPLVMKAMLQKIGAAQYIYHITVRYRFLYRKNLFRDQDCGTMGWT